MTSPSRWSEERALEYRGLHSGAFEEWVPPFPKEARRHGRSTSTPEAGGGFFLPTRESHLGETVQAVLPGSRADGRRNAVSLREEAHSVGPGGGGAAPFGGDGAHRNEPRRLGVPRW